MFLSQERVEYFYKMIPKLSQEEMLEIMKIASGAWYQCPQGHFYSIGECGQAMEQSRCPECNQAIGGSNHTLLSNNRRFNGFNINNNHVDRVIQNNDVQDDEDDDDIEWEV
jgi:hypothetical protein